MVPVLIVGVEASGLAHLSPRAREGLASASLVAGSRRLLAQLGPSTAETWEITDQPGELVQRLRHRGSAELCVVLASGDPLFYGIGFLLGEALGRDQIEVLPAVSSMQLAFARAGLAWHDAVIASVRDEGPESALLPLLGRSKLGLFTRSGSAPARIAEFFLERGLDDYDAWVGENLGGLEERMTALPLTELPGRTFSDLNVLLLHRRPFPGAEGISWSEDSGNVRAAGISSARFHRPKIGSSLLEPSDLRAMIVARFRNVPPGPLWVMGAGVGGVAIELARACPKVDVLAFERSPDLLPSLRANRREFSAYNIRIVESDELGHLLVEPSDPVGVYVSESVQRVGTVLRAILPRLDPAGVLVAAFSATDSLANGLECCRVAGCDAVVSQLTVSHGRASRGLTVMRPQKSYWLMRAVKVAGRE